MKINFFITDSKVTLSDRRRLKEFIKLMFFTEETVCKSVVVVFCSDDFLLNINQVYLNHDYFTDIITFNLSELRFPVEGEIYISIDRITENAHINEVSINHELHRIMFHGVLHLCGYLDNTTKNRNLMSKREDYYLKKYFF